MVGKIGVLALQGAFSKHCEMLKRLNIDSIEVRRAENLDSIIGLIIPGGESTAMNRLNDLPLATFRKPIFGTCAGMILLSQFGLLDIGIQRNAYGRQSHSFSTKVDIKLDSGPAHRFHTIFIRAPQITSVHSNEIKILSSYQGHPILVRQGENLGCAFHPELTNDPLIHHYFVQICQKNQEKQSPQQQLKTIPTKSFQMT